MWASGKTGRGKSAPRGIAARSIVLERDNRTAGEVLTAKQAPHRPGTAPALGLRAGGDGSFILSQAKSKKEVPS
jgi:hypothetical protein